MCDDVFYPSLNGEEDIRWTYQCQNTATLDLTSIVDALENGQTEKLIVNPGDISNNLLNDVELIEKWVDSTLYPGLYRIKNFDNYIQLTNKLNCLAKRISKIYLRVAKNVQEKKKPFKFSCSKCKKKVTIHDKNCVTHVEKHFHLVDSEEKPTEPLIENMENLTLNDKPVSVRRRKNQIEESECSDSTSTSTSRSCKSSSPETSNSTDSSECSMTPPEQINIPPFFELNEYTKVLYPNALMNTQFRTQKHHMLTLQKFKPTAIRCLVCNKDFYNEPLAIRHLTAKAHTEILNSKFYFDKLKSYHLLFNPLANKVTIHTTAFVPCAQGKCYHCKVCRTFIPDANILEHVHGSKHKKGLLENAPIKKYYFYDKMVESLGLLPPQNIQVKVEETHVKTRIIEAQKKVNSVEKQDKNSKSKKKDKKRISPEPSNSGSDSSKTSKNKDKQNNGPNSSSDNSIPHKREHNVTLSMTNKPKNVFESLELRLQVHNKFFIVEGSNVTCSVCNLKLPLSREPIKEHIISMNHLKMARKDLDRKRWSYFCDLCSWYEYNEFKWAGHLENIAHKQRVQQVAQKDLKGGRFMEWECDACLEVIYGNAISINKHSRELVSKSKKKRKAKEYKLNTQLEKLLKSDKLLEERIQELVEDAEKMMEHKQKNLECCSAIERALEHTFPRARALPFGSRVTGIGSPESDLDVFVDTGMMYDGSLYQDADSQSNLVKQTTRILRRNADFDDINPIPSARTPIIQVYHRITGIDCDLSFRHGLSVENTEFLRICIDVQPCLKRLILILKNIMAYTTFDRISTYALSMMAIFYMQTNNYLPSLKKIRELDPTPSRVIAGWHTFRWTKDMEVLKGVVRPCDFTTKELLINFFKFYMDFKYSTDVICPLMGHTILKTDFNEDGGLKLPPEMDTYTLKILENQNTERFRHLSPMCIQDPFDLSHNLTKACPVDYVARLTAHCTLSYNILNGNQLGN